MTTPESPDSVNATPPAGQPDVVLDIAADGESRAALATSPRWSGTTASGRLPGSD